MAPATYKRVSYSRAKPVDEVTRAEEVDAILETLQSNCGEWHSMPRKQKIGLLQQVKMRAVKASVQLGHAFAKVSGYSDPNDPEAVPPVQANLRALYVTPGVAKTCSAYIQQLQQLDSDGKVPAVECTRKTADGRNVLDMGTTNDQRDDMLVQGAHVYQYTQTSKEVTQGKEAGEVHATAGAGAAVVLGAGNQPMLSIEDSLHMLLDKNLPVLLKHHPAQAEVAPLWEYVMEPLEKAGVYRGIFADLPLTQAALYSERTAAVHLTGALQTYESILWGPGEEGQNRKANGDPLLKVPFTAELGNVTPAFVTPGEWTHDEMLSVAKVIVFGTTNNAGCNCIATKAIVMSAEWPQADEFEEMIKAEFRAQPDTPCWYPGSKKRYETFLEAHPGYELMEGTGSGDASYSGEVLPWAIKSVTLTSEEDAQSIVGLQEEFFAPVVTLIRVPTSSSSTSTFSPVATNAHSSPEQKPSDSDTAQTDTEDTELSEDTKKAADGFLLRMPSFADKYLFGNLGCAVFLPDSVKSALPETSQNCLDNLKYGMVTVNNMPIISYGCRAGTWGGYMSPESSQKNVGSGIGKLHNFSQVDDLQKLMLVFPWGYSIGMSDPSKIPSFLVPVLAGVIGGGLRGVLAALAPW